jgi:hypothetical protein
MREAEHVACMEMSENSILVGKNQKKRDLLRNLGINKS